MAQPAVIILAAGFGKRMGLDIPKVLCEVRGKSLLEQVLTTAAGLNPVKIAVVTGHKRELVEAHVRERARPGAYSVEQIEFAHQAELLGTGDAVKSALPLIDSRQDTVLILCGDMPLVRHASLEALLDAHSRQQGAGVSLLTLQGQPNSSFGRILRDPSGNVCGVVEFKDASPEQRLIAETNSAIYAVSADFLRQAVARLSNQNAQAEYYLTDIVADAFRCGRPITALALWDGSELQGVNTRNDLALISLSLNRRKVQELIEAGVEFEDPQLVFIDDQVSIAAGARIGAQVWLKGATSVGAGTVFEGCAYLENCQVGQDVRIRLGVRAEGARIANGASIGPFAHLRAGTVLGEQVRVGNFVEVKKSTLAAGVKASHLSYLGDCTIDSHSNIGAGTITCNYDGFEKHATVIGKHVFIGSNSALVGPVTIGDGAVIGAGSVITKSVEPDALALTRPEQKVVPQWAKRKRAARGDAAATKK